MQYAEMLIDRRINGIVPDGHPCHKLLPIDMQKNNVSVEIIQCSVLLEGAGCSLIRIIDKDGEFGRTISDNHTINMLGEYSVVKTGKSQYLATVMNNNCKLAQIVSESGCFLTSAIPKNDDEIMWTLFAPTNGYITNLVKRMREEGYGATMMASVNMNVESVITDKQDEVIKYAYENGYYDVPKKINTDDLCLKFGCSKSTMSVMLREAERKIIASFVLMGQNAHSYRKK